MSDSVPTGDWQDGHRYADLMTLDRAGLAWEFLRRDPAYRPPIVRLGSVSQKTGGTVEILPEGFPGADPWGLSFR